MGTTRRKQAAPSEASSSGEEDDEVYIVEGIKASRYDPLLGQWRYLIKWQGYSEAENTWEPLGNLSCPDLLAAYEKEQQRKGETAGSQVQKSKPASRGRKSDTSFSASTSTPKSSTPKSKGKGKSKVSAPSEDEDDQANEATVAQLDERRAAAKKQASNHRRVSHVRAEDAVASKWENKVAAKAASPKAAEGAPTKRSPTRDKSQDATQGIAGTSETRKRPRSPSKATSKSSAETSASQLQKHLPSEEGPSRKRPQVEKTSVKPETATTSSTVPPTSASSSSRAHPPTSDASSQRPLASSTNSWAAPATTAIRAMQFKRRPPIAPHASLPPSTSPNHATDQAASSNSPAATKPGPLAENGAQSDQSEANPKPPPTATRPSVRFADESESTTAVGGTPRANDRAAATAAKAAPSAASREDGVANLESRLVSSEYYRRTAVFEKKTIAAACADAVRVSHGTVLRMKGRGVAIICDSRDVMVSGEGIALGFLLMLVGAIMPKQLSEVAVVCIHRRETLAPLEKMFVELVNTQTHHVEFLHFGDEQPIQPILISGFLIVPTLGALQLGMAVESFCLTSHRSNTRTCTVLAHPASIALARSRLPQWPKIMHTLGASSIPIVEKQDLSLNSAYVGIDKSRLLATEPTPPLPEVTPQSEIAEITNLLCRKREQEPSKWRRFVIIVDGVDPVAAEAAKERGVELRTWVGLTELTRECIF